MITISFYSYKGGVGRSLALTNLGVYLAQFGVSVVMVDFDLEAPGLQYKIRPGSPPVDVPNRGLAGLLAQATEFGAPPDDMFTDVVLDLTEHIDHSPTPDEQLLDQQRGRLLLVPAGNPLEADYWNDLSRIDWPALFSGSDRPGLSVLAELRQSILDEYNPEVMLVDSRTGITPSGGITTTLLPDVVVTMFIDNPEHLDGTRTVISAIANDQSQAELNPKVVPVLSRYTGKHLLDEPMESVATRRALIHEGAAGTSPAEEDIPLDRVWEALLHDLGEEARQQVVRPLVLHADLELQHRERLSFGPYAPEKGGALLDDYLRLFSNLVPKEMVTSYLSGVRSRVRAIILDRPDDAVRTLENLAALVGDEGVFVDLVKIHVLRRDFRSMLLAADRLFRIHETVVVEPALSRAVQDLLSGRARPADISMVSAEFLEAYWRNANPTNLVWGAGVVRAFAERGLSEYAGMLAEELAREDEGYAHLGRLLEVLSSGNVHAERLAVTLVARHLESAGASPDFMKAAALAWSHQPSEELAVRLAGSPAFDSVPDHLAVDVLRAAGREDEASALLVEALADADPYDRSVELFASSWMALVARNRNLRAELETRNPGMVDYLELAASEVSRRPRRFQR